VESELGFGATFLFRLPSVADAGGPALPVAGSGQQVSTQAVEK
jgi:hypothetical protein